MSATRLLVLGTVRKHGTAHGYRISSELHELGVEQWANVKTGSLYHALRQMEKEGLLEAEQIPEWPGRVDYSLTDTGEEAFLRLLRDALRSPTTRPDLLSAGVLMMSALPRAEVVALLEERGAGLEKALADIDESMGKRVEPEHLNEMLLLWSISAGGALDWTRKLLRRLRAGKYELEDTQT